MSALEKHTAVLILSVKWQRDAWLMDRDRAALRRDMRAVHRIEDEARSATTEILQRGMKC